MDFSKATKLQKVQHLKSLGATPREIAVFFNESGFLTKPTAKNNYVGMQATIEDAKAGNVTIRTSHENYNLVIKNEGLNADGTRISEEETIKRYKNRLAKTNSRVVEIKGKGKNKQFKTEQAFKNYKNIKDSIPDVRRVLKTGKYGTDPDMIKKLDSLEKDILPLYNQESQSKFTNSESQRAYTNVLAENDLASNQQFLKQLHASEMENSQIDYKNGAFSFKPIEQETV